MPSIINEMRERRQWEEPKRPSPVPLILGVMVAFAVGGVAAFGYLKMPSLKAIAMKTKPVASDAAPATDASAPTAPVSFAGGPRIGRAETAPLLRNCVPLDKLGFNGGLEPGRRIEPRDIYPVLQAGAQVSRIAAIAGIKQQVVEEAQFASIWGDVADCVYRQNGWALCDPDNRALAVEATNTFVRQVNIAIAATAKPEPPPSSKPGTKTFAQVRAEVEGKRAADTQYQLQAARAVRDRVLAGLRSRAGEGRLIASDFGYFAPAEVAQVFKDVKPTRNACADSKN